MTTLKFMIAVLLLGTSLVNDGRDRKPQKSGFKQHRVASAMVPYIGGNKVAASPPKGYEDLLTLWVDIKSPKGYRGEYAKLLVPDSSGVIPVRGRLVFRGQGSDYQNFEFRVGSLIERSGQPIRLVFNTKALDGASYSFRGIYTQSQQLSDRPISLEGEIRKFVHGRQTSKTMIRFVPFNIKE